MYFLETFLYLIILYSPPMREGIMVDLTFIDPLL